MSNIINDASIKNPIVTSMREQLEHRALWLWYMCDEAEKHGLKYEDIGCSALKRCGLLQGAGLVEKCGTKSLTGLKRVLFTKPAQWAYEIEVLNVTDDEMNLHFHYCPLVKAWQNAGCTDEEISRLCSIAMCNNKAIAESYGCEFVPGKTIASGSDICEINFIRK